MDFVPPQTLAQEDLNLLRNDKIKLIWYPLVYQTILEWGFVKPKGEKIIDHFKDLEIEEKCGRNLKNWLKRNKDALQKEDFSSFDVTTLHDLLPVLCYDKVTGTGGIGYEEKLNDTNSVEYLLKEIKSFRNDISHDLCKAKEETKIEEQRELMRKCIKSGGALYGKDQTEIDAKIEDLDTKLKELLQNTNSSYENEVQYITKKIESECPTSMLEKHSSLFTVTLPGGSEEIDSSKIFKSVNISMNVKDKDKMKMKIKDICDSSKNKIIFSSSEICKHATNKFVVISGGPGSGKTTLTRHILKNILENTVNGSETSYEGIERFRVPVYLECRDERENNFRDFLKESTNLRYSKDVIHEAFKKVRGLVFIIDGCDEATNNSKELVKDAIEFCRKNNATCFISGRVDAVNYFISILQRKKLQYDYNMMHIEHISEIRDKLNFLRKYGEHMKDVDSNKLVKSFENQKDSAQKVFFCPFLLKIFISLFVEHRGSLSQLHNEQSAYKAIRENFIEEIKKKLDEKNVANTSLNAKYLLEVLSDYSLRFFRDKKYFFKKEEFLSFTEKCSNKISSNDVDFKRLFSFILTPETSYNSEKADTYAFTHSTIQEYLAVEQINKNMRESTIDWNSDQNSEEDLQTQFLECLGVYTARYSDWEEVRRYGNIIKLLILETLANEEIIKYTKTFTVVLRKYFGYNHVYLFDLGYSSNCDAVIVSIVSDIQRDCSAYPLHDARHIRPLTELLKKKETRVAIELYLSESLTKTNCANLGQLVSVLKDDSKIELNFDHSYDNYEPLDGEFYKELKKSKCKVNLFSACVASPEHLAIVMKVYSGNALSISTDSASDLRLDTLDGLKGTLSLRIKYTDNCLSTRSNPVTGGIFLIITDIPADGKENVFKIIKYLSPESKKFCRIVLLNCKLIETDANELLKKLEREEIRIEGEWKTAVVEKSVNEDNSRELELCLREL